MVVLVCAAIPAWAALVVKDSPGGIVGDFIAMRDKADADGQMIIIRGLCLSSCTIFLSAKHYCVDRNAVLGFHGAFLNEPGDNLKEGARLMMAFYPLRVREWINAHGGLRADLILLHGEEMRAAVNICA